MSLSVTKSPTQCYRCTCFWTPQVAGLFPLLNTFTYLRPTQDADGHVKLKIAFPVVTVQRVVFLFLYIVVVALTIQHPLPSTTAAKVHLCTLTRRISIDQLQTKLSRTVFCLQAHTPTVIVIAGNISFLSRRLTKFLLEANWSLTYKNTPTLLLPLTVNYIFCAKLQYAFSFLSNSSLKRCLFP